MCSATIGQLGAVVELNKPWRSKPSGRALVQLNRIPRCVVIVAVVSVDVDVLGFTRCFELACFPVENGRGAFALAQTIPAKRWWIVGRWCMSAFVNAQHRCHATAKCAPTHSLMRSDMHMQMHNLPTCTRACTHAHALTHARTHPHTPTRTHARTHARPRPRPRPRPRVHALTHKRARARNNRKRIVRRIKRKFVAFFFGVVAFVRVHKFHLECTAFPFPTAACCHDYEAFAIGGVQQAQAPKPDLLPGHPIPTMGGGHGHVRVSFDGSIHHPL